MFRALTCPSSGGKIVFTQHLVSSLSVNVCTVHWLRADILLMNKENCALKLVDEIILYHCSSENFSKKKKIMCYVRKQIPCQICYTVLNNVFTS